MNRRRRELLAALQPVVDLALERETPARLALPIAVKALSADTTEVMIYGTIGANSWWDESGVTASGMAEALRNITSANIHVRINSGGGDVFEGVAIHTLLARHSATVTTFVDGIAASAASFIAMAGDKVVSARNAMMMIHDGMTFTYGNPKTHRRSADLLDKVSDNIADMYAMKTGGTAADWRALMSENDEDGTWYTGSEAQEAGLVDELVGEDSDEEVAARVRGALHARIGGPSLDAVLALHPEFAAPAEEPKPEQFVSFEARQRAGYHVPADPVSLEFLADHPDLLEPSNEYMLDVEYVPESDNSREQDQAFALLAAFHFAA